MKRTAVFLLSILAVLFFVLIPSASALSGSDYTDDPELARKIDRLIQGDEVLFSNSTEKYGVGSRLDPDYTYMWKEDQSSGTKDYAYAQAVYFYLFGDDPQWGDHLSYSSLVPSIKRIGRLSYAMLRNTGVGTGAYIRTTDRANGYFSDDGYSMILLTYDSKTITYLHGDADGNGLVDITSCSWRDFNNSQLAGIGRCVAHVIQPNLTAWTKSSIQKPTTLEFREISYPKTYRINLFHSWNPIIGTLFTDESATLESIQSFIMGSDGTVICDTGVVSISGNTYLIKSLDDLVQFNWISEEGQYYWTITAKDSEGRDLHIVMPFTAVASGTTEIDVRSIQYPDSDTDPVFPEWENEWVYRIEVPEGLNLRSIAGASGEVKMALAEGDLFTVVKKLKVDDYIWGYGTSSTGATGWAVVDNEWTTLVSAKKADQTEEPADPHGATTPGDSGDANGDGKLDREDIRLMIRYYADPSLEIDLQNCDLDYDGEACSLEDIMLAIDSLDQ